VSESIFLEIKNEKKKNFRIGCVYRHHTPVEEFMSTYFTKTLETVTKTNKNCAITGDFNADLIKYGKCNATDNFYDQLSSYGFRPLILQPTRVTANSATLIDNIFINNVECFSKGGNITSAISDHFLQFSQIDIFDTTSDKPKGNDKHGRNWRIFNKREFEDEISQINWDDITSPNSDTDQSFSLFYNKIIRLLDEMAPMQKLTKKEIGLKKCPWITYGILASMRARDALYKKFTKETDPVLKENYFGSYKAYRNRIIALIRTSKKQYYAKFFEENNSNVKKTWDGIRNLINVNKKSSTKIDKIFADSKWLTEGKDIANSVNKFFVNIGSTVEDKIPQSSKSYSSYLSNFNFNSVYLHECSQEEVLDIIQGFSTSKACGPYSIPTKILKEFSNFLITPITAIINKSLREGIFPSLLKNALVCAIFKKGDKTKCGNYRPISLLSNISKIFERIMYNRIESFLDEYDTIYEYQFGFRKNTQPIMHF
jgi:flavodoxin